MLHTTNDSQHIVMMLQSAMMLLSPYYPPTPSLMMPMIIGLQNALHVCTLAILMITPNITGCY